MPDRPLCQTPEYSHPGIAIDLAAIIRHLMEQYPMPKSILLLLLATLSAPALAESSSYTLDPSHTYPCFAISHMGFSTQRGCFDKTSGNVTLDRAAQTGAIHVRVDAASIHTGDKKRDEVLRGEKFFNVQKYPAIEFTADSLRFEGEEPVAVNGKLTLLGVTRPLRLTINHFKCGQNPMLKYDMCAADVSAVLKRSDFGMNAYLPLIVGDEVTLQIQVEAVRNMWAN